MTYRGTSGTVDPLSSTELLHLFKACSEIQQLDECVCQQGVFCVSAILMIDW